MTGVQTCALPICRLVSADAGSVAFNYKDYRADGAARFKTMTVATGEFIRLCNDN